jgi:ubiquitin-protein ligase
LGLEKDPLEYASLTFPNGEEDFFVWHVKMVGPPKSPYAGGAFWIQLDVPAQYPFKPPSVQFLSKVYHPGIETETGNICSDVINNGWGPTLNIRHILKTLYQIMENPEMSLDHPLEATIATLMRDKPKDFKATAVQWTKEYASPSLPPPAVKRA